MKDAAKALERKGKSETESVCLLTNQIRERQTSVSNNALHLMELRQMRRIHRLVPEHPINTEQLRRPEPVVLQALLPLHPPRRPSPIELLIAVLHLPSTPRSELVQHVRGGGGRVCSEEEFVRFGIGPGGAVA